MVSHSIALASEKAVEMGLGKMHTAIAMRDP